VDLGPQSQIEDTERRLYELAETGRYDGGFQRFARALTTAVDMAAHAYQRDGKLSGLATGLRDLDRMVGGLQSSDLVILAGRPGSAARFRPHRRGGARDGNAAALHRRDRRPHDRTARGTCAPPQAAEGPRPPGDRLHPAAARIEPARRREPRAGGDRDHDEPQGAGEGTQPADPRALPALASGREPRG